MAKQVKKEEVQSGKMYTDKRFEEKIKPESKEKLKIDWLRLAFDVIKVVAGYLLGSNMI